MFTRFMKGYGFKASEADRCLFVKQDPSNSSFLAIAVYVDDIILAHKGVKLEDFISSFTGPDGFNSKHLGTLNRFLGMGIDQHDDYSFPLIKHFTPRS